MRPMLLFSCVLVAGFLPLASEAPAEGVEGITRPSKDVMLSFVYAGRIASVQVKQGDLVEAGQVLARQDDASEQAQLTQLKAQAEETIRIRAAEAQLAQKKVDLAEKQWAFEQGAVPKLELDYAELDVTIGELTVELSKFEHEQSKRKYDEVKLQVERMQLKSPIAGRAEGVFVEEGESVDAQQKAAIRVVLIDPLWIDAPVPLARGRSIKTGDEAHIAFDGTNPDKPNGRVIHVSSVADAASGTLTVRVEAPNPTARPAGERVEVRFSGSDPKTDDEQSNSPVTDDNSQQKEEGVTDGKEPG